VVFANGDGKAAAVIIARYKATANLTSLIRFPANFPSLNRNYESSQPDSVAFRHIGRNNSSRLLKNSEPAARDTACRRSSRNRFSIGKNDFATSQLRRIG